MMDRYSGRNPPVQLSALVAVLAGVPLFWGCSSNTTSGSSNGGTNPQGGTVDFGGSVAFGGSLATGGFSMSGGSAALGGTTSAGGLSATGGRSPATGGNVVLGGSPNSGGTISSGGATSSGGASSSGGVVSSGGAPRSGGTISSGGATNSGGATSSGGTSNSGGASSLGGATNSGGGIRSGGVTSSGGTASSGGATRSGGTTNNGGATSSGGTTSSGGPSYPYIFACFNDSAPASTLMIYKSDDALNFTVLYDTGYGGPTGNLRDPSIMKHSDGKFYIVHTTPPSGTGCCGAESSFNVASSSNLKDWTTVTQVPCGVAGVKNVWAPEWFKDTDGSIHVLASIDGKTYRYEPTDGTFTKWSGGTWINIGPGFIDTFMVKIGTTYHAFTKLEKDTYVEHATSTSLDGPWDFGTDVGDWAGWGNHKEAPCLIELANGTWRFYTDAGSAGHEMYSDSTDVFQTWSKIQTLPTVGSNISHGTVIKGN